MTKEEQIAAHGRMQIMETNNDPHCDEVANIAEDAVRRMLATGATSNTVLSLLGSLIGYAIGNGARETGATIDNVRAGLSLPLSTMTFAALDVFANGSSAEELETVQ